MRWDFAIRRIKDAASRHAGDGALMALFVAALVAGAPSVLLGMGKFAQAITPDITAQASDALGTAQKVDLSLGDVSASRRDASALIPVVSHVLQDGLRENLPRGAVSGSADETLARDPNRLPNASMPVIAICIDDLGGDLAGTVEAMSLPSDVTLSFLPYAGVTPALAVQAEQAGHQVLAHVPMEPIGPLDPGPMTLKVGAPDIAERLAWSLARVPGIAGINNHEGSKFSTDTASLMPVARALSERHLFFFDSRTISGSQVVRVAHMFGVASAGRDVFLDNVLTNSAIESRLNELAAKAKTSGVAIAIGHPHDITLRLVAAWLAQDHGVRLVPVSEAIRLKTMHNSAVAAR